MKNIHYLFILFPLLLSESAFSQETVKYYTDSNLITNIAIHGDYIWCGTTGGVVRWNRFDGTYELYTASEGLIKNDVSLCHVDRGEIKTIFQRLLMLFPKQLSVVGRHRYVLIGLLLYWPALFAATHIPVPDFVGSMGMSDKKLHYLAYLILVSLLWFAVSPHDRVNWKKAKVWIVLAVIVWYGAIDDLSCILLTTDNGS